MAHAIASGERRAAGQGRLAALLALLAAAPAVLAEPPDATAMTAATAPPALAGGWDAGLVEMESALLDGAEDAAADAPAHELAAGLDVQVAHKRRKFRARAVDWMAERAAPMGLMTDLLLGGADEGFHLVVDPTGTEEYILEWKARFR